jgi:hypothetical protein
VHLKKRDIREKAVGEKAVREKEVWERDFGETVGICRFAEQLPINIHIRGVSGCLSFSQSLHSRARFLQRHKLQIFQLTQGMCFRS